MATCVAFSRMLYNFFNKQLLESVFSCDVVEKGGKILAATGGEDDKAYLWDVLSGEVTLIQVWKNHME